MKKLSDILAITKKYGVSYIPNNNVMGFRFTTPNLDVANIHKCVEEIQETFHFRNLAYGQYKAWSKTYFPDGEGILGYEIVIDDQLEV